MKSNTWSWFILFDTTLLSTVDLAIFGGFIPPPGEFYPLVEGINLDVPLCTIPTVGPYKKQGEEAGERGNTTIIVPAHQWTLLIPFLPTWPAAHRGGDLSLLPLDRDLEQKSLC